MLNTTRATIGSLGLVLAFSSSLASGADLIVNGNFDADLSGWVADGGPGVTYVTGAANLGQPGTPDLSTLSQTFNLTNANVAGSFDFTWEVNAPTIEDNFSVVLQYTTSTGTGTVALFTQGSNSGSFGAPVTQAISAAPSAFIDFVAGDATLIFSLQENNTPTGTRVQLDNVTLSQVPIPAAAWLFASGLVALISIKRRS